MSQQAENTLLIRLPESSSSPVFWYQSEVEQGQLAVSELAQLAEKSEASRVLVIVPGELVSLTTIEVSGSLTPAVIRSLPYRLEEDLGSDVENVHLAILDKDEDQLHLAIVENSWMELWKSWLQEAGIKSRRWLPETLVLPWHAGHIVTMARDSQSHVIRSGQWQGAVCDTGWLPLYLESVQSEQSLTETQLSAQNFFSEVAKQSAELKGNLLQGDWRPAREQSSLTKGWQQLRLSAVLMTLIVVVWSGSKFYNSWEQEQQVKAYQQSANELFADTFPGKRAIRPLSQMKSALKSMQGLQSNETGFLEQLDKLAPVFKRQSSVVPVSISYQKNLQQIRITAEAGNIGQFTDLRDRIAQSRAVRLESLEQKTEKGKQASVTGALIISGDRS
ncbi:hypothetical protein EOPP23_04405 [Endozoicomonas sp. OPT23]|uniref:type II secretion system protein GspL n=1 Tax=Endozoicomonas sp. OPT23 TaxID=2072845 RepID=UPI00129AB2DD|nr:type II secretion system protein GspL [Endozoicomonas sp. OPT23]MRI32234.1 hypothetical protein [Endozoicomonas sp. OPT23]